MASTLGQRLYLPVLFQNNLNTMNEFEQKRFDLIRQSLLDKKHPVQQKTPSKALDALTGIHNFISTAGAHAVSKFAESAGNLLKLTDYINPVSYAQKAMGQPTLGEGLQKGGEFLSEQPLKAIAATGQDQGTGAKIGAVTGDIAGTIAAQVPAMAAGGGILSAVKAAPGVASTATAAPTLAKGAALIAENVDKYPKLFKALDFAAKSVGTTGIISGQETGELPTPTEIAAYGALDVALFGLTKLGSSLYKSAFKGTAPQERNYAAQFNQTIGETAEQLGYWGTAKQIKGKAVSTKKTVWDEIIKSGKSNNPVTNAEFMKVADKLKKPYSKLPDSGFKDEIIGAIDDVVEKFAPKESATGEQLIATIKEINAGLFGNGSKFVLTPKQAKNITSNLKSEIKDILPKEIRGLYKDYSINRTIESIMDNAEIKNLVARIGIGSGAFGITYGVGSGLYGERDMTSIVKNTLKGALIGALLTKMHSSTLTRTLGGTGLKQASEPVVSLVIKSTIENLRQMINPPQASE